MTSDNRFDPTPNTLRGRCSDDMEDLGPATCQIMMAEGRVAAGYRTSTIAKGDGGSADSAIRALDIDPAYRDIGAD